jgi:hypothetical protein
LPHRRLQCLMQGDVDIFAALRATHSRRRTCRCRWIHAESHARGRGLRNLRLWRHHFRTLQLRKRPLKAKVEGAVHCYRAQIVWNVTPPRNKWAELAQSKTGDGHRNNPLVSRVIKEDFGCGDPPPVTPRSGTRSLLSCSFLATYSHCGIHGRRTHQHRRACANSARGRRSRFRLYDPSRLPTTGK